MKLYELPSHYLALQERAEEGEDVSDLMQQLDDELELRATSLVKLVRGLEAETEALQEEERRLKRRRDRLTANSEAFRSHVRDAMLAAGINKIKAPTFTITLRDGNEKVLVQDEKRIPETYVRVKREVNRAAILDAYKTSGECVEGTSIVREPSLQIK